MMNNNYNVITDVIISRDETVTIRANCTEEHFKNLLFQWYNEPYKYIKLIPFLQKNGVEAEIIY